jgi:UDP-glucose 4-epimerase
MGSEDYHHPGVEYVKGHTKDISKLLPNIKPKYIFHMGEYSRIEVSFDEPDVCLDLNTVGTIGVVEFWRKNGGKLIYAGSSTKFAD